MLHFFLQFLIDGELKIHPIAATIFYFIYAPLIFVRPKNKMHELLLPCHLRPHIYNNNDNSNVESSTCYVPVLL